MTREEIERLISSTNRETRMWGYLLQDTTLLLEQKVSRLKLAVNNGEFGIAEGLAQECQALKEKLEKTEWTVICRQSESAE